jgi:hypothetical protein
MRVIDFDVVKLMRMLEMMAMNKQKVDARFILDLMHEGFFDVGEVYDVTKK